MTEPTKKELDEVATHLLKDLREFVMTLDDAIRFGSASPLTASAFSAVLFCATKRAVTSIQASLRFIPVHMREKGIEPYKDIENWRAFAMGVCDGISERLDDDTLHQLYQCAGTPGSPGRALFDDGVISIMAEVGWLIRDPASIDGATKLPGVSGVRE